MNQLVEKQDPDGSSYKVSAESGHRVEWTQEENFLFRLSAFQEDLLHWLKDGEFLKSHEEILQVGLLVGNRTSTGHDCK